MSKLSSSALQRMTKQELIDALETLQGARPRDETESLQSLVHELQVHQVELEMQNRDLRETQGRLEEACQQYADLYDFAPITYCTLDRTGCFLEINLTGAGLLEYDRAKLIGKPFSIFLQNGASSRLTSHLEACRGTTDDVVIELQVTTATGKQIDVQMRTVAVRSRETGDLVFRSAIADISELKATQEALLRQSEKLARSNRDLEQFAFAASHDLQEPLRKVLSFGDLLKTAEDGLDEKRRTYVDRMQIASRRMSHLIDDILHYSRISQIDEPPDAIDLKSVLREVLDVLDAQIVYAKARLDVDADLPTVLGCRYELVQLFQNLISNAIKYRGERPPVISIGAEREDDHWRIYVRDNGIGVESGQRERIFGLFVRAQARTRYSGTGVGLALCKKIVEKHGGRIGVDSTEGEGATFYFTLPATDGAKEKQISTELRPFESVARLPSHSV